MAESGIKNFELIEGLDYRAPDIIRSVRTPKALTNLEFSDNGLSLRSRRGVQLRGQPGDFIGIADYHFSDAVTGATRTEIIAMNFRPWKLSGTTFTITRAGAGPYLWHHEMALDAASGKFRFKLFDGDTKVFDQDCGSGLAEWQLGMISVWQLIENINSGTGGLFTATQPTRSAKVDTTQSGVTSLIVDLGHTYVVGDVITLINYANLQFDQRKVFSEAISGAGPARLLGFGPQAATVDVLNNQIIGSAAVPAASLYISTGEINTVATKVLSFQFWDYIPSALTADNNGIGEAGYDQNPWTRYWGTRRTSGFKLPGFLSADNNLHIYTNGTSSTALRPYDNYPFKYDGQSCYRSGVPPYYYNAAAFTDPIPVAGLTGYPLISGGGSLTGTYKYSYRYKYIDARGIERVGNPSHFYSEVSIVATADNVEHLLIHPYFSVPFEDMTTLTAATVATNTLTVPSGHNFKVGEQVFLKRSDADFGIKTLRRVTSTGNTTIVFNGAAISAIAGTPVSKANYMGLNAFSTKVTTSQTAVGSSGSPLIVTSSLSFNVGDTIYLRDTLRNVYTTRLLTGVNATSIWWDTTKEETIDTSVGAVGQPGPATDVNISKNFRIEIFRTKAGGNTYYKVDEVPIPSLTAQTLSNGTYTYIDSKADADLLEKLTAATGLPDIGYELDMPPQGSIACSHQGLTFISGDPANPNQIAWSLPNEVEAFPLASNYSDIPSGVAGPITAIGSDNENRLAVFKKNSYTDLPGDFTNNTFTARTVKEGDYGVSSHQTLLKVDGELMGLGLLGFVSVNDGVLSPMDDGLTPAIIGNYTLDLGKAIASNDFSSQRYRCYIPTVFGFSSNSSTVGSLMFMYDYDHEKWFDWNYPNGIEPSGGMMNSGGLHMHLSKAFGTSNNAALPGHLFIDLYSDQTYTTIDENYADNHIAITTRLKLVFTMGEPSVDKQFLRVRVFSVYSPYEINQFTPHSITCNLYKNFQETSSFATLSLPFTTIDDYEAYEKCPTIVARSLVVEWVTNTLKVTPHITGIEVVITDVYNTDDKP